MLMVFFAMFFGGVVLFTGAVLLIFELASFLGELAAKDEVDNDE